MQMMTVGDLVTSADKEIRQRCRAPGSPLPTHSLVQHGLLHVDDGVLQLGGQAGLGHVAALEAPGGEEHARRRRDDSEGAVLECGSGSAQAIMKRNV